MGFSKYFKDQSDKMWAKGKDMIKYVLKRGGKMGANFQVWLNLKRTKKEHLKLFSSFSDSSPGCWETDWRLRLLQWDEGDGNKPWHAEGPGAGHNHRLQAQSVQGPGGLRSSGKNCYLYQKLMFYVFLKTAHKLEELSEDYTEEIHEVAKKLNTLGKLVRESSSNAMGLHLYDRSLM